MAATVQVTLHRTFHSGGARPCPPPALAASPAASLAASSTASPSWRRRFCQLVDFDDVQLVSAASRRQVDPAFFLGVHPARILHNDAHRFRPTLFLRAQAVIPSRGHRVTVFYLRNAPCGGPQSSPPSRLTRSEVTDVELTFCIQQLPFSFGPGQHHRELTDG